MNSSADVDVEVQSRCCKLGNSAMALVERSIKEL